MNPSVVLIEQCTYEYIYCIIAKNKEEKTIQVTKKYYSSQIFLSLITKTGKKGVVDNILCQYFLPYYSAHCTPVRNIETACTVLVVVRMFFCVSKLSVLCLTVLFADPVYFCLTVGRHTKNRLVVRSLRKKTLFHQRKIGQQKPAKKYPGLIGSTTQKQK